MEKNRISISVAQEKIISSLREMDLSDNVYEFAQDIFQTLVTKIEDDYEIVDVDGNPADYEHSNEVMWYDEIRENFFYSVYEKVLRFLNGCM